jgi:phosphopantetheine adenylyltransferase
MDVLTYYVFNEVASDGNYEYSLHMNENVASEITRGFLSGADEGGTLSAQAVNQIVIALKTTETFLSNSSNQRTFR